MNKILDTLLLLLVATITSAQVRFTEHITRIVPGQGVVTVHQSPTITDLVNGGTLPAPSATTTTRTNAASQGKGSSSKTSTSRNDTLSTATPDTTAQRTFTGQKIRVNGYRIQVYSGGNSRDAKMEAQRIGMRVHNYFEDVAVYTNFQSPHWNCRVGDFTSREEALTLLREMRQTGRFQEAVIVKCKVNVYQ